MVFGMRITHSRHAGSVLPMIATRPAREGVRLGGGASDPSDIMAVIFAVLAVILLYLRVYFYGILMALTAVATVGIYLKSRRMKSASIFVRPWPLRLGEQFSVKFTSGLHPTFVNATLECVEESTKSTGDFRERKQYSRFESTGIKGEDFEWTFEIPPDGIPSFSVDSNKVRWLLKLVVATSTFEQPLEFEILVLPEVRS